MRIYISSTSLDLLEYRSAVINAIQRAGHDPICMEYHAAGETAPKDECLREVAASDVYIGIFAWRYGYIPPNSEHSITELEYREALRRKIPAIAYLLDENTEWPVELRESGFGGQRIDDFRGELKQTKWVRFFNSPDNLAIEVLASISTIVNEKWQREINEGQTPKPDFIRQIVATLQRLDNERNLLEEQAKQKICNRVPVPIPDKLIQYFQDRDSELAELKRSITNDHIKMILVCGRGGMGKTSLVTKLLNEIIEKFESKTSTGLHPVDSIIYVPLGESGFRTLSRIIELISRTLEPQLVTELNMDWDEQSLSPQERLKMLFRTSFATHHCLFFLDNLESILDKNNRILTEFSSLNQFIELFFEHKHSSTLLITSRRAISLTPKTEVAAIGRRIQISLDEGLPDDYAVSLLCDLDSDGNLGIKNTSNEELRSIVRKCQCIPRTLETLIGTLLQHPIWTLQTLLNKESFFTQLVEDPARELYSSLSSEQERLIVKTLAIYDHPVPVNAIRFILPSIEVEDILERLVSNFIVMYDRGLFWLHPLDQRYAYSQISQEENGYSKTKFHKLAAQYFEKMCKPENTWMSVNDIEPQLDEIRHLLKAELYDKACEVLNEIDREYLSTWGYSQLIIELRSKLLGHITNSDLEGLNFGHLGSAYNDSGDAVKAREFYEQALSVNERKINCFNKCRWLGNIGISYGSLGDMNKAIGYLTSAYNLAIEINDRLHEGRWLGNLTSKLLATSKITRQKAIANYLKAIEIAKEICDGRFEMIWSEATGDMYYKDFKFNEAKAQYNAALYSAQQIHGTAQKCRILLKLADVYNHLGEIEKQASCYEMARKDLGDIHNRSDEASVLIRLGNVYANLDQRNREQDCYDEALDIVLSLEDPSIEHNLLLALGDVYSKLNNREKQKMCLSKALVKSQELNDTISEFTTLLELTGMEGTLEVTGEINDCYNRAIQLSQEKGDIASKAVIISLFANALLKSGNAVKAIEYYQFAIPYVTQMNDKASLLTILNRLGMASYFLQDVPKAINFYEQALTIAREMQNPNDESIYLFNIGDAYHLQNQIPEAIAYYKRSLALDYPLTNYKCAVNLGIAYMQINKLKESKHHFEECIRLLEEYYGKNLEFHPQRTALGLSLLGIGKFKESLDVYESGLKLTYSKEDLHYAIQDLQLLGRVPGPINGLDDVISLLKRALSR